MYIHKSETNKLRFVSNLNAHEGVIINHYFKYRWTLKRNSVIVASTQFLGL